MKNINDRKNRNLSQIIFKDINDFVILRSFYGTNTSAVQLLYHIQGCQLVVAKKTCSNILEKREIDNYKQIRFPTIPKFYSVIQNSNEKIILMEFINGILLNEIHKYKFDVAKKFKIITDII